ncbi:MAG: hypothetical protein CME33_15450 [Gimesia sp.]|uniref:toll/interleukin-1 receptor domain-containing protein n=1 Tax=Gimesia sp. TaxID=2024833 RepID=UPI000C395F64|nr:toll/interleukin-1 receptor domain-containing protein [Gimesia sp.]MAX37950.1 hypothetical protein [Gimesia sp.]
MKHIFISHTGHDSDIADRLYNDLKDVGHDIRIDLKELTLGDDTIDFMNEAIADAHTVLIIFSEHTESAVWQRKEINAAVWNETAQDGGKVIVVKVGNATLPPLLGPKTYGSLDPSQYKSTLQRLCSEIVSAPSATSVVGEALSENSTNPFWRVRAEYFEEMPVLMAQAFSPPVSGTFSNWEEMLPCFLEGSRGTGKTMLLLSLRARILAARTMTPDLQLRSKKGLAELFGIFIRLGRGAICNAGFNTTDGHLKDEVDKTDIIQLSDLFSQEFYLCIIESLISEIIACMNEGHISLDSNSQSDLATSLVKCVCGSSERLIDCDELLDHFAKMHEALSDFIRRKFIYRESPRVPFTHVDIKLFKRVVSLVRRHVTILKKSQFTILLDEYENLLDYQKLVVNSLVKFGPPDFSVKVARKAGTIETSATNAGQELQEKHDYTRIPLIYSVEDDEDFGRYLKLLDNMVRRTLSSHKMKELGLSELLPADDSQELSYENQLEEILTLHRIGIDEFNGLTPQKQKAQISYYREAAIYRYLYGTPGRRTKKRFSGHRDLAFVSSGVIRYFQEIVGMAYHLKQNSDPNVDPIASKHQTEAVYIVSDHNLSMLSKNVEELGESLKYFLLDLGDCLRQKLLKHTSEPEAGRIAIRDPELLSNDQFTLLKRLIHTGVKEGVFQTVEGRPGIRPKHVEDPQPVEINIARIYAPTLQISPRLRWTTPFLCSELAGLLSSNDRRKTKLEIIERVIGKKKNKKEKKSNEQQGTLFKDEDE